MALFVPKNEYIIPQDQRNTISTCYKTVTKAMAIIRKNSFTIFPRILSDSFGEEIYSSRRMSQLEGMIMEGMPYG